MRLKITGWVAIAAATVFLAWASWTAWQDDGGGKGGERAALLRTARTQIATLNTLDRTKVDAGFKTWLDVSTGPLHDQLKQQSAQKIQQAKTSATGTVTEAAVLSFDPRAGKAKVIAAVRIKLVSSTATSADQRKRFEAGLTRTPAGWKLESLTAIQVGSQ
ncbi:hypothetical protein [Spirillospora sp. CA-294931]|uniref:hypothetical protein n=1 Tax=Spirillospora sp. CA-294931 TaxID=3240042 RepID=UPI003D91ED17